MQARRGGARAPRRTSKIRPKLEVAPPAAGRDLRPCIRSKLASSLLKGSMPAPDTLTFPGTATPPCRGGLQTSLLASCAELPDHIDRSHTAATHTLVAASVQGRAPCASVTTASTLRALCSIGFFAWPCQPIVGRAAGTEVRSRTRGVRVFKGTDVIGRRMKAAATRQRLARREQLACIDGRSIHKFDADAPHNLARYSTGSFTTVRSWDQAGPTSALSRSRSQEKGRTEASDRRSRRRGRRYPRATGLTPRSANAGNPTSRHFTFR